MVINTLLMTVEAFEEALRQPENAGRHLQLVRGEIVEDMPIPIHGLIIHTLNALLYIFLREHPIGWVLNEVRCKLLEDPFNSRIPDLAFVSRQHGEFDWRAPLPFIPDLVIEVQSPGDTYAAMRERAAYFLAHGAGLVWLIFPDKQQIEVYPADDIAEVLGVEGELAGRDALPGFAASVRTLFDVS
ncbi:MAG: Uma2 family endonuclease [Anaerolineae bacterium]|nr:Uma2 family endonuclease [Anaerolineae bacterium]NUQ06248.1 Uma2 family endonuclease [Anaerolineae bacterium]